jgi:hypothetical protein
MVVSANRGILSVRGNDFVPTDPVETVKILETGPAPLERSIWPSTCVKAICECCSSRSLCILSNQSVTFEEVSSSSSCRSEELYQWYSNIWTVRWISVECEPIYGEQFRTRRSESTKSNFIFVATVKTSKSALRCPDILLVNFVVEQHELIKSSDTRLRPAVTVAHPVGFAFPKKV